MRRVKVFKVARESEMKRVALWLLKLKKTGTHGMVLSLTGNLGAGKTTLVKFIGKICGVDSLIVSPSFVLLRIYKGRQDIYFVHLDAWRIGKGDLAFLGFSDLLKNPKAIVCVEWADRVKQAMPAWSTWVKIEHISARQRKVTVSYQCE
jgi:tRNA threonylcarbamoyladenosine biosynthesis protein TsaE